ncbi:CpaD family pilus assembly protein [Altererythrobacter sp. ZODW24]|uniref:CpaD family pilus assembly protein n=1 Tax=Altererythrobacter sp. ZODW24 TaxID=2185142 RepID=UPI000DF855E2|nr:CpaD family pilus assembly protein [Altererythrobacter sp. ZODW24]
MIALKTKAATALAISMGLVLSGCNGGASMSANRGVNSVNQPVVERTNYTLDVQSGAGGLPISEQRRLASWFEAMDLGYGDRIAIDDPMASGSTVESVQALASRYGLLVSEGAPVTAGYVDPGFTRVVVTRSTASVPGCPDWSKKSDRNYSNKTSPGYGCAINGNLAAMVADPEHLINGAAGTGETVIMSSNKAIQTYRDKAPTGEGELSQTSSSEGGS